MLSRSIIKTPDPQRKSHVRNRCSTFQMDAKRMTSKSMCTRKARWPVFYCFQAVCQAPFSFVKYVYCVHVLSFLACVAGVRNFKNVLLINQRIYVRGWVFACYQYWGILYWILNGLHFGLCQKYGRTSTEHRDLLAPFLTRIDLVGAKSKFLFGYRKGQIERKCQSSF